MLGSATAGVCEAARLDEDDADLVLRARNGDREALGTLLARHGPALVRLCRRLLGNATLAEDCAQDAYLLALLRLHRLRSPEHFGPWLRGIGIRACRRTLQRRDAHDWPAGEVDLHDDPGALPEPESDGAAAVMRSDLAHSLRRAVQDLPAGQRQAVYLFYLEGLTYDETAAALGIATGALRARLHKARAALRHRFRLRDVAGARDVVAAWPRPVRRMRAVHEAAHAVLHWQRGGAIPHISISPVSGTYVRGPFPTVGAAPHRRLFMPAGDVLQMLMAGEAATFLESGHRSYRTRANDLAAAAPLARDLTGGDEVEAALLVDDAWVAARDRLTGDRTWSLVERIAEALLAWDRVDGDDFRALVSR